MLRPPNWTQKVPIHTEEMMEHAELFQVMSVSTELDTSLPVAQIALLEPPMPNQYQSCLKLTRESSNHMEVVSLLPMLAVEPTLITPSSWSDTLLTHGSSRTHGVPDGEKLGTSDSKDGLEIEELEYAEYNWHLLFLMNIEAIFKIALDESYIYSINLP